MPKHTVSEDKHSDTQCNVVSLQASKGNTIPAAKSEKSTRGKSRTNDTC